MYDNKAKEYYILIDLHYQYFSKWDKRVLPLTADLNQSIQERFRSFKCLYVSPFKRYNLLKLSAMNESMLIRGKEFIESELKDWNIKHKFIEKDE
jgi:hypothetical protein